MNKTMNLVVKSLIAEELIQGNHTSGKTGKLISDLRNLSMSISFPKNFYFKFGCFSVALTMCFCFYYEQHIIKKKAQETLINKLTFRNIDEHGSGNLFLPIYVNSFGMIINSYTKSREGFILLTLSSVVYYSLFLYSVIYLFSIIVFT